MKKKLKLKIMSCINNYVLTVITVIFCMDNIISENVAEITENEETTKLSVLPATEKQLEFLAEDVCDKIGLIQYEFEIFHSFDQEKCEKRFSSLKRSLSPLPARVNFKCRTQSKVNISSAPSNQWQLVVLVPEDDSAFINFEILAPLQEIVSIYDVDVTLNYTLWTTVLHSDGTPSIWLQGPRLPTWKDGQRNYNVTVEGPSLEINNTSDLVDAAFKVYFSGDANTCSAFIITNMCDKLDPGIFFHQTITPISYQTITIKDLLKNDHCSLSVKSGKDVVYRIKYPTKTTVVPEEPKDVSLEPVPNVDAWDIIVRWQKPKVENELFNVTLRAPGVFRTVIIPGNMTSWVFEDVREQVQTEETTYFNVSIQSFIGNMKSALAISRAPFPERKDYKTVIVTGSWSIALTVAAAAIGIGVWWKRKRDETLRNLYFSTAADFKQVKECLETLEQGVEDSWELRSERLLLHEVIGEGEFGVVRRGTLAPGVKDVAVKMLKDFPTQEEVRSFRAEMELMKSVGTHPHIVNLVGCCSGRRPLIVAEYCSRGDLLSFLRCSWDIMVSKSNAKYYNNNIETSDYRNELFKKQNDKLSSLVVNKLYDLQGICDTELTSLDLLSFCRQIAMGMEFLASNRVVHRDLAARNILVTADRTLKITDFGLSRDVYQENHYKQKGNGKLPVKWMALESLTRGIYTSQSDVWSFGVVVWEIVTVGAPPYASVPATRLPRLLRAGYRMPRPNNCSKQLYELMLSCWQARPRDRPTFPELHRAVDDLLNCASADEYLTLELDYEPPPAPKSHTYSYIKMLLRGNRVWAKGESYEPPLKTKHYSSPSNHYTLPPVIPPPASLTKVQLV